MPKNSFNHNKLAQSFRQKQSISTRPSTNTLMYEVVMAVTIDYKSQMNLIKHRPKGKIENLSVDESIDVLMEMLCRMLFQGRMKMFQEGLKTKLIEVINEALNEEGGDSDANAVRRKI